MKIRRRLQSGLHSVNPVHGCVKALLNKINGTNVLGLRIAEQTNQSVLTVVEQLRSGRHSKLEHPSGFAVPDERMGPVKKSKFTEEQIVYALRQVEGGTPPEDICRQLA